VTYPLTALISDLHANIPALETALADARGRGAERYVCLGDVVGYGASPRECLDVVMSLCSAEPRDPSAGPDARDLAPGLCLLGNHEHALLNSAEDFNPKARSAIEWTRETLNDGPDREAGYRYWDFLGSLSPIARDERALFVHGSPRDPVREYLLPRDIRNGEKMRENFSRMDRGVCFVGHSHVPAIYFEDGRIYRPKGGEDTQDLALGSGSRAIVNVGSVGQPRDGDPRLSYALFDGESVTFVRLEYDTEAAAAAIRAVAELPVFLAERLAIGR
jgi:diadenosine tetraphosphatase ApaH/serine/threonine PP2A family protein phosphatase